MLICSDSGACIDLNRVETYALSLPNGEDEFVGILTFFIGEQVEELTVKCLYVLEALLRVLSKKKAQNCLVSNTR